MPSGLMEDVGPDRRGARVCAQHVCIHSGTGLGLCHSCPKYVCRSGGQTGMSACGERLAGQDWAKGVCQSCGVPNQRGHAGSEGLSLLAAAHCVTSVHERG